MSQTFDSDNAQALFDSHLQCHVFVGNSTVYLANCYGVVKPFRLPDARGRKPHQIRRDEFGEEVPTPPGRLFDNDWVWDKDKYPANRYGAPVRLKNGTVLYAANSWRSWWHMGDHMNALYRAASQGIQIPPRVLNDYEAGTPWRNEIERLIRSGGLPKESKRRKKAS